MLPSMAVMKSGSTFPKGLVKFWAKALPIKPKTTLSIPKNQLVRRQASTCGGTVKVFGKGVTLATWLINP